MLSYCLFCVLRILVTITTHGDSEYSVSSLIIDVLPTLLMFLKSISVVSLLSSRCTEFDSAIKCSKNACLLILNRSQDESVRRMCKNVLRMTSAHYTKLRACGVMTVDASLPLRMCALIATYTVVLLQFALL